VNEIIKQRKTMPFPKRNLTQSQKQEAEAKWTIHFDTILRISSKSKIFKAVLIAAVFIENN
jgi:hypothetical protein